MSKKPEPESPKTASAWTNAIRRRSADEEIREKPYEARSWMRYFGTYRPASRRK